jgi:hypothetical protein
LRRVQFSVMITMYVFALVKPLSNENCSDEGGTK